MLLKNFLLAVLFLFSFNLCFSQAHFVCGSMPASPYPVNFTQANGSGLTILLKGDEFLSWAKTTDGYLLLNNQNGSWEYAIRSADGDIIASGISANNPGNRDKAELQFLSSIPVNIFFSKKQIDEAKAKRYNINNRNIQTAKFGNFPTTGTRKMLMILVNFNNTTTTYTQTQFNNYMNQSGYNYNGAGGSFRDFYLACSLGQLTVNTTVIAWVTVPHPHNYYGPSTMWSQLAYDAVVACHNANPTLDFSQFENSGGVNDGIAIIHEGTGQEASGNTNDVWSHSGDIRGDFTLAYNGVTIGPYTMQPERINNNMTTIGVMCHEFGHNCGLPDLYDTDYSSEGMGNWDLMAGGSWNNNGQTPPVHNVWSKYLLGWVHPTVLNSPANGLLHYSVQNADCYKINTATPNEYFLLENRQQTSWDTYLPGHGMLIFHIDGSYINAHFNANTVNDSDTHQGVDIVEADNITTGSNGGDSGNPFPGTSHKYSFTDTSNPNSLSWAGTATNKPITAISENVTARTITFSFMGGVTAGIGVPGNIKVEDIDIYPNPSSGIFNISLADIQMPKVNVKIYNVLGVPVYNKQEFSNAGNFADVIDLSSFEKGIYFIVIESGKESFKRKIILK